jgi:hypothetical protein
MAAVNRAGATHERRDFFKVRLPGPNWTGAVLRA